MRSNRIAGLLLAMVVASFAGGQMIVSTYPGTFLDISQTGGTALPGIGDDTIVPITTTVGNAMFPAGNVSISDNGFALGGTFSLTGIGYYTNADILPTGPQAGMPTSPAFNGILMPFWDDLYPFPNPSSATVYWQELSGVLYIMWKDDCHIGANVAGQGISFEIQVFSTPGSGPWIQYVYTDTVFGGTGSTYDNGVSATVGYVSGALAPGGNAKWSFNTASLSSGMVLSIFPRFGLTASSPFGSGSLQLDLVSGPPSGTYFMAVSLSAGAYPNGWFYGIDLGFPELGNEISAGFPFLATLDALGNFTIGPIGGAPPGLVLYAVALGIPAGSPVPTIHSAPLSYTIP